MHPRRQKHHWTASELADVVIAGGFWHGCDGEQGTAVSSQRFTQIILSVVDLSSTQSTQLLQMHLQHGVGVWVMVGKVADIIFMLKGHSEGHSEVGFALLTPGCNGAS